MKHFGLFGALIWTTLANAVFASCPDFLNHSMRQLASTQDIQFCEAYEGKTLLIVNTASYCGYTIREPPENSPNLRAKWVGGLGFF